MMITRKTATPKTLFRAALCAMIAAAGATACTPPAAVPGSRGVPGFDTRDYPGDDVMRRWRDASPYRWVGYYLPAPCYTGTTWAGRRTALRSMGWGFAVLAEEFLRQGRAERPRLWIARAEGFDISRSPWESGYPLAAAWQGRFNIPEAWDGATLNIDVNVADSADPSRGR